jgi:hypothetical protein
MKEGIESELIMLKSISYSLGSDYQDLSNVYYNVKMKGYASRMNFFQLIVLGVPIYDVFFKLFNLTPEEVILCLEESELTFNYLKISFECLAMVGDKFTLAAMN